MKRYYRVQGMVELDEEGRTFYVVHHPGLPGCMAQSLASFAEARKSLDEARELYLSCYRPRKRGRVSGRGGALNVPQGDRCR